MSKTAENRRTLGMRKLSLLHRMKQIAMICFAVLFSVFSISAEATDPDISVNDTGTGMCVYDVLDTYSGTAGLKARWEPNEIDLYWYSDDTQITNVSNSANSCSYAGGLTVPATPTKTGYTFNGWKVRGLPDGYTRLEYLESYEGQYIDTGKRLYSAKSDVKMIFQIPPVVQGGHLFGGRSSTSGNVYTFAAGEGVWRVGWGSSSPYTTTPYDKNKHLLSIEHTNGVFKIDGVTIYTGGSASFSTPSAATATLFAIHATTSTQLYYGTVRIFSYRLFENGELVQDFIPARRNSDSVLGMYDTVSKTFFTNAGSGTFTAGPVVN